MVGEIFAVFYSVPMDAELVRFDILGIEEVVYAVVEREFVVGDAETGGCGNESIVEFSADTFVVVGERVVVEISAQNDVRNIGPSNGSVYAVALASTDFGSLAEFSTDLPCSLGEIAGLFSVHEFLHAFLVIFFCFRNGFVAGVFGNIFIVQFRQFLMLYRLDMHFEDSLLARQFRYEIAFRERNVHIGVIAFFQTETAEIMACLV